MRGLSNSHFTIDAVQPPPRRRFQNADQKQHASDQQHDQHCSDLIDFVQQQRPQAAGGGEQVNRQHGLDFRQPQFDEPRPEWDGNGRVATFLEVEGNGDYLPPYAGNLDIMTAAAARVGELLAESRLVSVP